MQGGKGQKMFDWFQKRSFSTFNAGMPQISVGQGGLLAGTHVASNLGWRPVEALTRGDQVLTFDHGMMPIVDVQRETVLLNEKEMDPRFCPLLVPRDALNNRVPMYLMPDQGVLLESDLVEDLQGDPFAVVPACALEGYRGIERMLPDTHLPLITLRFASDEVIYLEAGLLGYAPAKRDLLTDPAESVLYSVLSHCEARDLVQAMIATEACTHYPVAPSHSASGFPVIS